MKLSFFSFLIIVAVGWVEQAHAHRDVSVEDGNCLLKLGPDTMSFPGYQPVKTREQFCDDIPDAGPTIITFDAQQNELGDMYIELRMLRRLRGG